MYSYMYHFNHYPWWRSTHTLRDTQTTDPGMPLKHYSRRTTQRHATKRKAPRSTDLGRLLLLLLSLLHLLRGLLLLLPCCWKRLFYRENKTGKLTTPHEPRTYTRTYMLYSYIQSFHHSPIIVSLIHKSARTAPWQCQASVTVEYY